MPGKQSSSPMEERSPSSSCTSGSNARLRRITVNIRSCVYGHAKYCEAIRRKNKIQPAAAVLTRRAGERGGRGITTARSKRSSPPSLIFGNSSDRVLVLPAGGSSPRTRRPSGLCLIWLHRRAEPRASGERRTDVLGRRTVSFTLRRDYQPDFN